MKHKILIVIFIFVFLFPGTALDNKDEKLTFAARVPEDYGVYKPSEALSIDKFVLELMRGNTLITDENVFLGSISEFRNGVGFSMLYYGNLGYDYDVKISVDATSGFVMHKDDEIYTIPVEVSYQEPKELHEGITVSSDPINNSMGVHVAPVGPLHGERVLDVFLEWDGSRDLVPGIYQADVDITIEAV